MGLFNNFNPFSKILNNLNIIDLFASEEQDIEKGKGSKLIESKMNISKNIMGEPSKIKKLGKKCLIMFICVIPQENIKYPNPAKYMTLFQIPHNDFQSKREEYRYKAGTIGSVLQMERKTHCRRS